MHFEKKKKKSIWKKFRIHFVLFDLYLFFQLGILNSARQREPEPGPKANTAETPFCNVRRAEAGRREADARSQRAASPPFSLPFPFPPLPRAAPRSAPAPRSPTAGACNARTCARPLRASPPAFPKLHTRRASRWEPREGEIVKK